MTSSELSLYDVLGVAPDATPAEIKVAFYAAIKRRHPDIDRTPGAHDQTVALLEAYQILADPEQRKRYDLRRGIVVASTSHSRPEPTAPESPPVDAPAAGGAFLARPAEPATFEEPVRSERRPTSAVAWFRRIGVPRGLAATAALQAVLVGLALPLLVLFCQTPVADSLPRKPAVPDSLPRGSAMAESLPRGSALATLCLDPQNGLSGDRLYGTCVKTRVELHLLMMRASSEQQIETYTLKDALAEMRQAVGAAEMNLTSTKQFTDEVVATLATMKTSAKDERVRSAARTYYDCYLRVRCREQQWPDRRATAPATRI